MKTTKYTDRQKEKDENIIKYIESKKIEFYSPNSQFYEKFNFLKKGMGYNNLLVGKKGKQFIYENLEDCAKKRINQVVQNTYLQAKNRIEKSKRKNIEGYIQGELF